MSEDKISACKDAHSLQWLQPSCVGVIIALSHMLARVKSLLFKSTNASDFLTPIAGLKRPCCSPVPGFWVPQFACFSFTGLMTPRRGTHTVRQEGSTILSSGRWQKGCTQALLSWNLSLPRCRGIRCLKNLWKCEWVYSEEGKTVHLSPGSHDGLWVFKFCCLQD